MSDERTTHAAREDERCCASECPDGWIRLDAAGRVVGYNLRFFEVWGLTEDEIAAIRAADPETRRSLLMRHTLVRVRDPETVHAGMRRQLTIPEQVTFEDIALTDGRILERYGVPLRDRGGNLVGRAVSLRDVTARRQLDVELRERARQQKAIADFGEVAINASDVDLLLEHALRVAAQTLGAEVVHLLELSEDGTTLELRAGDVIGDGVEPERLDPATSPAAVAAARGSTVVVSDAAGEVRYVPMGHARRYAAGASVVVRGRDRPFGVLCAHWTRPRGFSEDEVNFLETIANVLAGALARREAERQVLEREREVRAVFDASLDGLLTFGDDGLVAEVNPAAGRIFESAAHDMVGRPVFSLFGEEVVEHCRANFGALVTTGRCSGEQELRIPGRPQRIVEYAAVARILPGRNLIVLRDVTEQRQMQARLALADRMASVGTLAAGMAHELNNPLSYVSANLSYVAEALDAMARGGPATAATVGEELAQAVREAREGAIRMRTIIRDLRTFSRGDEERNGAVDLRRVLESCVNMARNEMKHRARFVRSLADVPPVRGNEARLGQVFLNLLVNAAQAIPEGAAEENTIRLATSRWGDGRVAIEVSDTGGGIAPEDQRRIFDPFFTTKPVGVGMGLGLSICHNIVASLGGHIEVESAPGRGATFRVLLPVALDDAPPHAPTPQGTPAMRRARVLVVDDDRLAAASLRRALESEHEVEVVGGALEAFDRLASDRFDVVVSDLLMPEMTGMDLHAKLTATDPDLAGRMIFITGGAFTPAAHAFVERHAGSCLEKPFEFPELRELVRRRLPRLSS